MTRILEVPRNRFAEALTVVAFVFVLAVICGFGRPSSAVSAPAAIAASAPTARIELSVDGIDNLIEAELPRARYLELGLKVGHKVFVAVRAARVFPAAATETQSG